MPHLPKCGKVCWKFLHNMSKIRSKTVKLLFEICSKYRQFLWKIWSIYSKSLSISVSSTKNVTKYVDDQFIDALRRSTARITCKFRGFLLYESRRHKCSRNQRVVFDDKTLHSRRRTDDRMVTFFTRAPSPFPHLPSWGREGKGEREDCISTTHFIKFC